MALFDHQLFERDQQLSRKMRIAENPGTMRTASAVLAHSGDSWFWGAGLLLVWYFSAHINWRQWSLFTLLAVSVLAAIVMTMKFIIRRRRPEGEWGQIYRSTDPHSFPSGHAARAFLIAAVALAWGPWQLALSLLIWAPLVSLARVAMGVHYVSDVVAGALVGVVIAAGFLILQPQTLAFLQFISPFPLW